MRAGFVTTRTLAWCVASAASVLAPARAWAQSEPAVAAQTQTLPSVAIAASGTEPPSGTPPLRIGRGGRIVVTSVLGALSEAAGVAALGLFGFEIGWNSSTTSGYGDAGLVGLVLGAYVGGTLATWAAVQGFGNLLDGDGRWWATLVGDVAGAGVGFVPLAFVRTTDAGVQISLGVLAAALPLAGAVIGYEVSSHASRTEAQQRARQRAARVRGAPSFAAAPQGAGAIMGAGGVF